MGIELNPYRLNLADLPLSWCSHMRKLRAFCVLLDVESAEHVILDSRKAICDACRVGLCIAALQAVGP